jgi:hypothetical protein
MMTKPEEEILLDTSRNLRHIFEARLKRYTLDERVMTAKAIAECAKVLSKRLGHSPDNYIFGRNVFSREEAQKLIAVMRRLQVHAEESRYERGVTAAMGLRGIACLVYAHKLEPQPASDALIAKDLLLFADMMNGVMALLESELLAQG